VVLRAAPDILSVLNVLAQLVILVNVSVPRRKQAVALGSPFFFGNFIPPVKVSFQILDGGFILRDFLSVFSLVCFALFRVNVSEFLVDGLILFVSVHVRQMLVQLGNAPLFFLNLRREVAPLLI
jgi:hypothetical protein